MCLHSASEQVMREPMQVLLPSDGGLKSQLQQKTPKSPR